MSKLQCSTDQTETRNTATGAISIPKPTQITLPQPNLGSRSPPQKQVLGLTQCYLYRRTFSLQCLYVSVGQREPVLSVISNKTFYLPASSVRKSRLFIRPFISDPISKLFAVFICFNIIYLNNPDWSSKISKIFL